MAAKGDLELLARMNLGNMPEALRQVAAELSRVEGQTRRTAQSSGFMATSMNKLGRSALYGVGSYFSVTAARGVFESMAKGVGEVADKRAEFEKTMTPLLSLGENMQDIRKMKDEVLLIAEGWNQSNQDAAQFLFDLQSNASNLGLPTMQALKRETLELVDVAGGDLPTALKLLTTSWQNYGKQLGSVNELQNKLFYTQQEASLTFPQLAERLPDLLAAGQVAGAPFEDLLATVIASSKKAGNAEKLFTGLRNFFLILNDKEKLDKAGVDLQGSYVQRFAQLSRLIETDSQVLQNIFDREVVVAAQQVVSSFKEVDAQLQQLKETTGEVDIVQQKYQERLAQDTGFLYTRISEMLKAQAGNVPLRRGEPGNLVDRLNLGYRAGNLSYRSMFPDFMGGIVGPIGGTATATINALDWFGKGKVAAFQGAMERQTIGRIPLIGGLLARGFALDDLLPQLTDRFVQEQQGFTVVQAAAAGRGDEAIAYAQQAQRERGKNLPDYADWSGELMKLAPLIEESNRWLRTLVERSGQAAGMNYTGRRVSGNPNVE